MDIRREWVADVAAEHKKPAQRGTFLEFEHQNTPDTNTGPSGPIFVSGLKEKRDQGVGEIPQTRRT